MKYFRVISLVPIKNFFNKIGIKIIKLISIIIQIENQEIEFKAKIEDANRNNI